MADEQHAPPPAFSVPVAPADTPLAMSPDELQRQLQAAADTYEAERVAERKRHELARRELRNQRELSQMVLMRQLPKLIGAACLGAVVAYLLPMGDDR